MIPICSQFSSYFYRILKTNFIVRECVNVAVLNIKLWFCLQKTAFKNLLFCLWELLLQVKMSAREVIGFKTIGARSMLFTENVLISLCDFLSLELSCRVDCLRRRWWGSLPPSVILQTIQDRLPSQWITALWCWIFCSKPWSYIFQLFIKRKFGQS